MEPEAQQEQLPPTSNPSESRPTSPTPGLEQSNDLPLPPKVTKTRRPRKKSIRVKKGVVKLKPDESTSTSSITDSNRKDVEQVGPCEVSLQDNSTGAVGNENKQANTESPPGVPLPDNPTSSIAPPNERPCQPPAPCTISMSGMETCGLSDEPTTFLLPICESLPMQRRKIIPQLSGITDEPTTFILPLCDGPPLPCQSMMSSPSPQSATAPSGYPVKIVHFGPPPHLLQMGQYFGPPPMVSQFQSQPTPIARIVGPQTAIGHFVGPPHLMDNFIRSPTPANTFFRPVFWDPRNPYSPHPFASPMVTPQMQFPGAFALGPKRKRPSKPSKPRKQRRRGTNASPNTPESVSQCEQTTIPSSKSESLPQESSLNETCLNQERGTVGETLFQATMVDNSAQETTMDDYLHGRKVMVESSTQETTTDERLLQETKTDGDSIQDSSLYETVSPQETVMALSTDVPDMCNEVEVESSMSLNAEGGVYQNEDDEEEEMEEFNLSRNPSMNVMSQDLDYINDNQRVTPILTRPSSNPVKTRRMSNKKDQKKLVFDRKSDAMVKAAKGLFTKRTRTLYTWLYPNTSKREVKVSVSKAWDLLPDSEKAYYLAQVDGRLGIHPGLMVNPQLEGLVKLPEGSTPFKPRPSVKPSSAADDSSEDAGSSDNETARAVRSLFASSGDVDTWASFTQQEADKKAFRRRTKRKSPDASDNELDQATTQPPPDEELEGELAKFRQILENEDHLNDDDSYWRVLPEPDPDELFLDIV